MNQSHRQDRERTLSERVRIGQRADANKRKSRKISRQNRNKKAKVITVDAATVGTVLAAQFSDKSLFYYFTAQLSNIKRP
jgi:hypothetical protein